MSKNSFYYPLPSLMEVLNRKRKHELPAYRTEYKQHLSKAERKQLKSEGKYGK